MVKKAVKKIDEVFAFISTCSDGDEGIIGSRMVMGNEVVFMPYVGADLDRVDSLIKSANELGLKYKILKFSVREDITDSYKGKINA
jgi:hypothetical protein